MAALFYYNHFFELFPSSLRLLTSLLVMTKILNLQKNKKYNITLQKINKILME